MRSCGDKSLTTFSVEEYADALLGGHSPQQVEWLVKRLRGEKSPTLPGFKAGRKWRATAADIEKAIELLRPPHQRLPELPRASSMTPTSRRRLSRTAPDGCA
ncbi:hypothetical protein SAMN04488581_0406 [Mycolicibacterium neoaurum]|uniref:hypothetical protein n=1 Tax=Mycolicibacterium neoaurum TaxID=1795 RepID=UPI00068E8C7E|nr:hypothetical protein [Mycolicibacterium neoaurum]SDC26133.1 hypothetical protein SAMN04488581_0406 [Mycolicibacterium neoaurum]